MHVLRIAHDVDDYDSWKQVFDSDPVGRKAQGVQRYTIMRAADKANHVKIDLEFAEAAQAEAMHEALKDLWGRVDVMKDPHARVVEVVETGDL